MKKQYVFLSHDVDWSFDGPTKDHVLKRKDRFDVKLLIILHLTNYIVIFQSIWKLKKNLM